MIVDGHIYRSEDGSSTGIEDVDKEEDEMVEVGQLEAHHSGWEALRFAGVSPVTVVLTRVAEGRGPKYVRHLF